MSISTPSYQCEPVNLEWGQTWPTRNVFVDLAAERRVIPVVRRVLADELSAVGVYRQLAHGNYGSGSVRILRVRWRKEPSLRSCTPPSKSLPRLRLKECLL